MNQLVACIATIFFFFFSSMLLYKNAQSMLAVHAKDGEKRKAS